MRMYARQGRYNVAHGDSRGAEQVAHDFRSPGGGDIRLHGALAANLRRPYVAPPHLDKWHAQPMITRYRGVPFVEMADIDSMARFSVPYVNILRGLTEYDVTRPHGSRRGPEYAARYAG